MNAPNLPREAKIHFGSPEFTILSPGDFVRCAVTGMAIPLDELRYWDPITQEAYVDAEAATAAWLKRRAEADT